MAGALPTCGGMAYREAGPEDGPVALMLHGYPQSSYAWRDALGVAADCGWHGVAPDLPGFGDSPPDRPGTWERHIEAVERLRAGLGLGRVVLVTHDWGALIGLRWACDHSDSVRALVVSSSGFFPDGKWHGMARGMRTEGTGEELVGETTRQGFDALLGWAARGMSEEALDEYWKCFADADRRASQLELYRSGDFDKLAPYDGKLADLDVPTLLLWGDQDQFAPLAGGRRLKREVPHAELEILEDTGHFIWDDEPERCGRALARFLRALS